MTSPKQLAANRENALQSTGPKTPSGKQWSAQNACRHGIRAETVVVHGLETEEAWEAHRAGVATSLAPVGYLEAVLADRVAWLLWRLERVTRFEREVISVKQDKTEDELALRRQFEHGYDSHPGALRDSLSMARKEHRSLTRLSKMADDESLTPTDAANVIYGVADVSELGVDPEELPLPGVPDELELLEEFDGWTAGLVRQAIAVIAERDGTAPDVLLERATGRAWGKVVVERTKVQQMERELNHLRRERLLPDGNTLQKISRYETTLERQLFRTMKELREFQQTRADDPDVIDIGVGDDP